MGLELKRSKTEYWARFNEANNVRAEELGATRTPEPMVLKQALPSGLTGQAQGMTTTMEKAAQKRQKVCNKVKALTEAGMGSHPAMVLLRAAIPADVSFTIRTVLMDYRVQTTLDNLMLEAVDSIVGVGELQTCRQKWACLALKDGGLGMMSMNIAAPCAHAASWGEALERIATQIGVHAYPQIEVRAPVVARMIEEAMNMCRTIGVDPEQKVREATSSKQTDLQKQWAAEAQARAKDRLMGELTKVECAVLRAAGGKGAGAWLEAHDGENEAQWLTDDEFSAAVAVRMALNMPAVTGCMHKTAGGGVCGTTMEGSMAHALLCTHGSGHNDRHTAVVKALAEGLTRELDTEILKEQYVPGWDRVRGGNTERARLDLVIQDRGGRTRYIDVTIGCTIGRGAKCAACAQRDGALAAGMEREKRHRYPGPNLIPAAIEHAGRMGESFMQLIRWACRERPKTERGLAARAIYRSVAVALQRANARMVLQAGHMTRKEVQRRVATATEL